MSSILNYFFSLLWICVIVAKIGLTGKYNSTFLSWNVECCIVSVVDCTNSVIVWFEWRFTETFTLYGIDLLPYIVEDRGMLKQIVRSCGLTFSCALHMNISHIKLIHLFVIELEDWKLILKSRLKCVLSYMTSLVNIRIL